LKGTVWSLEGFEGNPIRLMELGFRLICLKGKVSLYLFDYKPHLNPDFNWNLEDPDFILQP
jgi:hypothetical protein